MALGLDSKITENLKKLGTEPFIWWKKIWWSRGAFLELVNECEEVLKTAGFKAGHRLALLLPNSPVMLATTIAVWRRGGAVVPIDFHSGYVSLIKQIKHADVFSAVTFKGASGLAPLISEEGIPCSVTELDSPCHSVQGRPSEQDSEDTAVIFYTSGTTGEPKAVPLSHENMMANINSCLEHLGPLEEDDTFLNALPNFYSFGFVCGALLPLVTGSRQVALHTFMPAEATMEAIKSASVSIVPAVPTMISLLLGTVARGTVPPQSLRYVLSGGDRLPLDLRKRAEETLGVPVLEGYGVTEASSVISITPGANKRKSGSVGTLLSCLEGEIRDHEGTALKAGSEGHLWIRGASVAAQYYRNPKLTEERFKDGWFDTNDIAKIDDDGYLYLISRASDVLFVGGFNFYAHEVERTLLEHNSIAEAAVIGVPRSISGEVVKAFIVLKSGAKTTQREIMEFCRKKLAYYKVPRIIEFTDKLPHSATGEILKRKLVQE